MKKLAKLFPIVSEFSSLDGVCIGGVSFIIHFNVISL